MIKNFTFKIGACFTGDLIYLLKGIRHVCEVNATKADIFIWLDRPVKSYEGATHPYNGSGLNRYAFEMLKPLLLAQSYINSVEEFKGQKVAVDLDELYSKEIATKPNGSIQRWAGLAWPDMQADTDLEWIRVQLPLFTTKHNHGDARVSNKIIINRTSRWQNGLIHYWFLKEYKDQLIFAGLADEHQAFCAAWELDIPLLKVHDFLELAIAIKSCRYFIGNQSFCFALAEAMKVPRLLEVCPYAPNVITCGEQGYDFIHQFAFEWFVRDQASPLNQLK